MTDEQDRVIYSPMSTAFPGTSEVIEVFRGLSEKKMKYQIIHPVNGNLVTVLELLIGSLKVDRSNGDRKCENNYFFLVFSF